MCRKIKIKIFLIYHHHFWECNNKTTAVVAATTENDSNDAIYSYNKEFIMTLFNINLKGAKKINKFFFHIYCKIYKKNEYEKCYSSI